MLNNNFSLNNGEKRRLQKAIGERVYTLNTNVHNRSELFRSLYAAIKKQFKVESYKELKQNDLQKAIRFVENWIPERKV